MFHISFRDLCWASGVHPVFNLGTIRSMPSISLNQNAGVRHSEGSNCVPIVGGFNLFEKKNGKISILIQMSLY